MKSREVDTITLIADLDVESELAAYWAPGHGETESNLVGRTRLERINSRKKVDAHWRELDFVESEQVVIGVLPGDRVRIVGGCQIDEDIPAVRLRPLVDLFHHDAARFFVGHHRPAGVSWKRDRRPTDRSFRTAIEIINVH